MKNNKPKIGFTGPFADVNFGDYAMVVNNIIDINVKDVVLFSYDNKFLRDLQSDYLASFNIQLLSVEISEFINYDDVKNGRILTPIDILQNIVNYDDLANVINDLDILIVNGGGYFNSLWSMPHRIDRLVKIVAPILVANSLNKKIVFTGNGFGPFLQDRDFFTSLFATLKTADIGVRDDVYSPHWGSDIGIEKKNIKLIPDDLLVLNQKLKDIPMRTKLPTEKYMVMETYLPVEYISANLGQFKKFVETMKDMYDVMVYFLPFNLEQGGMYQALYLKDQIPGLEVYDIRDVGYLPIEDATKIIMNAEIVISSRYHALVVSLENRTPIVSVLKDVMGDKRYYYNKNYGVLHQALKNTQFDQRSYLQMDFIEAMEYITLNYNTILLDQNRNYNEEYLKNMKNAESTRSNYIESIKSYLGGNNV